MNFLLCFREMAKSMRRCRVATAWPMEKYLLLAEILLSAVGFGGHLRIWCPLKSLCQETAGALFGERALHSVGAGGGVCRDARCCPELFSFPFPLLYWCRRVYWRICPQVFALRLSFTVAMAFQIQSPHCIRVCFRSWVGCQKPNPFPKVTCSFLFSLFSGKHSGISKNLLCLILLHSSL